MGDVRDERSWVTLELSRQGEHLVIDGTLEAYLRRDLAVDEDFPLFIPTALFYKEGKATPIHLMEGYAFAGTGLEDVRYFSLVKRPYINSVLSTLQGPHQLRCLSVVSDAQIRAMRDSLREMISQEIPLRAFVDIRGGTYGGLEGVVIGLDETHAFVRVTLRSLDVVATIPRIFVEVRK